MQVESMITTFSKKQPESDVKTVLETGEIGVWGNSNSNAFMAAASHEYG